MNQYLKKLWHNYEIKNIIQIMHVTDQIYNTINNSLSGNDMFNNIKIKLKMKDDYDILVKSEYWSVLLQKKYEEFMENIREINRINEQYIFKLGRVQSSELDLISNVQKINEYNRLVENIWSITLIIKQAPIVSNEIVIKQLNAMWLGEEESDLNTSTSIQQINCVNQELVNYLELIKTKKDLESIINFIKGCNNTCIWIIFIF